MHGVYWLSAEGDSLDKLKLQSVFVDNLTILNSESDYMGVEYEFRPEELLERSATLEFLFSSGFAQPEKFHIPKLDINIPYQIGKYIFYNKYIKFSKSWLNKSDPAVYEFVRLSNMFFNCIEEKDGDRFVRLDLDDGTLWLDGGSFFLVYGGACSRIGADILRSRNEDAVSLNSFIPLRNYEKNDLKQEIISAVVKEIPTPSLEIPWEDIIAIKKEDEFRNKIRLFRTWAEKINSGGTNIKYLSDEIKTAIFEYEIYMKSMRVKYEKTSFEYIITCSSTLIEDIAKFRLEKLVRGVFSFREGRANLTLDEMKAPGRQLSIVPAMKERFR